MWILIFLPCPFATWKNTIRTFHCSWYQVRDELCKVMKCLGMGLTMGSLVRKEKLFEKTNSREHAAPKTKKEHNKNEANLFCLTCKYSVTEGWDTVTKTIFTTSCLKNKHGKTCLYIVKLERNTKMWQSNASLIVWRISYRHFQCEWIIICIVVVIV